METITFEEFLKIDIRVGTITSAERVPKSAKLLKLQVDFGSEIGTRQIVAGIGLSFEPDKIVNTTVCAVINLAPRKLMGLESHGMILAGHIDSGPGVSLVTCLGSPAGTIIG